MRPGRLAIACMVLSGAVTSAQAPVTIGSAAWLEGCWQLTDGNRTVEEIWLTPKGGSMVGVSRTIRHGKLTEYEMIVLREQGDRLAYVAHPSGQASATFLSTYVDSSELRFENPAHDFPQQIGYRRDARTLIAWISGTANGKPRRVEFPYVRVGCAQ